MKHGLSPLTLSDAIARHLDALLAEGRSLHTVRIYRACLRSFQRFTGDVLLAEVSTDSLRDYLKHARLRQTKHGSNPYRETVQEPLSRETIRTYFRHIRAFLAWCVAEGLLAENPAQRVNMPPAARYAPKDLSDEDFWKMVRLGGAGSKLPERDRALVVVLGDTGARASGIVGLTLDRLRLDEGLLEVIEKGDKSRLIPLSPVTVDVLRAWLAVRSAAPGVLHVFVGLGGKPLTASGLHQAIDRIARRAGVEGRSNLHAFRHFFGRKWVESGGDISTLAEVLGHTQIHVTKTFYLRYDTEMLRQEHREHSPLAEK